MKVADRYFVIDWYPGKSGGLRAGVCEWPTHEAATAWAYRMASDGIALSGKLYEEIEVFVGSKNALNRRLEERGAVRPHNSTR